MSFSTVKSAAMEGLAVEIVYVEADVSNGLPVFHMVGYLSSEVKEAAERVRSAVRNSGLEFPAKRVVINLSPATMRKRGASFDLPIAVAILTSLGVLQQNRRMKDCMIIGELGLDGQVRKVPGILSMVSEAKVQKVTSCIVPRENEKEAELVEGVRIIAVGSLGNVSVIWNMETEQVENRDLLVKKRLIKWKTEEKWEKKSLISQTYMVRRMFVGQRKLLWREGIICLWSDHPEAGKQ